MLYKQAAVRTHRTTDHDLCLGNGNRWFHPPVFYPLPIWRPFPPTLIGFVIWEEMVLIQEICDQLLLGVTFIVPPRDHSVTRVKLRFKPREGFEKALNIVRSVFPSYASIQWHTHLSCVTFAAEWALEFDKSRILLNKSLKNVLSNLLVVIYSVLAFLKAPTSFNT